MNDSLLDALSAELGSLLVARGWRVTAAESCTGGLVAGAITATAGQLGWFDQAFVTYSNAAKTAQLGVAGSAARGPRRGVGGGRARDGERRACARRRGRGVAVTGIAGPGGGTSDKPVGTVCFAWARRDTPVVSTTHRFDGDRAAIRRASVVAALEGLIERARADGAG